MPKYVDGFVLPVPKAKVEAYRRLSRKAGKIWREHGALQYCECVGDDMKTPMGMPFPKLVKPKPGETIIFAWIVYKSRKHRDSVNAKVMKDPRMDCGGDIPFDVKRMTYGGFEMIVDAD